MLYNASHQHDCTVVGGWPDTNPRVRWQKAAASVLAHHRRHDDEERRLRLGRSATAWSVSTTPSSCTGTRTSHSAPSPAPGRPAWAVDASPDGQWVVFGGEFPRVNNVAQQGLVRFRTTCRGARTRSLPDLPDRAGDADARRPTAVSLDARARCGCALGLGVGPWTTRTSPMTCSATTTRGSTRPTGHVELLDAAAPGLHRQGARPGLHPHVPGAHHRPRPATSLWSPVSNTVTVGNGSPQRLRSRRSATTAPTHLWRLGEPSGSTALRLRRLQRR